MEVLQIILIIISLIFMLHGGYFVLFGLFAFSKNRNKVKEKEHNSKLKFKVLIAARNEEEVIGDLIDSLKDQNYPKELYEICVIPNNCTDKTCEVSLEHGANIIDINVKTKTKGEVLNFVYDKFKNDNSFDAYVIFDADNILDPNFLMEMNNKLLDGYEIVQGFRDSKNLYDNWISSSNSLFYYLQNIFVYEARINISESANVNGTGYAFKKDLINKINYRARTVTEDIELTTVCAINDVKIGYASDAVFYDEQVNKLIPSFKQRIRWTQGTIQVFKNYIKDLLKAIKKKNSRHLMDSLVVLITPYVQVITFLITSVMTILYFNIYITLGFLVIAYLAHIVMSIYLGLYYKKNIKKMLPSIFLFAIFNITWLPICIYAVFNSNSKWESIKHTSKNTLNDLKN